MNPLDELLTDAGRVEHLPAGAIRRGQAALDDAVATLRPRRRLTAGVGLAAAAGAAAASAAILVAMATGSDPASTHHPATSNGPNISANSRATARPVSPAPTNNTIELIGYRIALPDDYRVGKAAVTDDTNCTTALHLSAEETKRLITTPTPGCPLLITSAQRTLPPDASPFRYGRPGDSTTVTGWMSLSTYQVYLPAKLPDGTTLYVSLHGSTIAASATDIALSGSYYNLSQLAELEHGMHVRPS